MPDWSKLFFDSMYRFFKPDWDKGSAPIELVAFVKQLQLAGQALDLGCGTGTSSIFLAQQGFKVVGVDFSPKAIELARRKAQRATTSVDFRIGDVARLDFLQEPFDFVLDVSCFQALSEAERSGYVEHVARLTHTGSTYLLQAFDRPAFGGSIGLAPQAVEQAFAPHFTLRHVEHITHGGRRPSSWYQFSRR